MRFLKSLLWLIILASVATLGVTVTLHVLSQRAALARLRAERAALQTMINRLTGTTRRAYLVVDGQVRNAAHQVVRTTLLWQEYTVGPHGQRIPLPIRKITIPGYIPHVDGIVVHFPAKFVEEGNLLRGKSLAFFRRIYGDTEAPVDGASLLGRGGVPMVLESRVGHPNPLERTLWQHIWQLLKSPSLASQYGVSFVQGEGPYRPVYPGHLYEILLANDGGLEFREKSGESGLVRHMLKLASQERSHQEPAPGR